MHSIYIFIVKKEGLEKLLTEAPTLKHTELPQEVFAITFEQMAKHFRTFPNIMGAMIKTDYFGGCGEQSATILHGNEAIPYMEFDTPSPINKVLREYFDIKKGDSDEFDAINLGCYRSNEDFL